MPFSGRLALSKRIAKTHKQTFNHASKPLEQR
jgi:hypothetical protein